MPGITPAQSFKTKVRIEGHWLNSPDEVDVNAVSFLLDALYDAWPWADFWAHLTVVKLWSEFCPDKPQQFKDNPLTSGLYWWNDDHIDLHGSQFSQDKAGVLAHECGHSFQDYYRLGAYTDAVGWDLWHAQGVVNGSDSGEDFASNVGRIFLRRLNFRHDIVPKGFEHFMEYVRQVRS